MKEEMKDTPSLIIKRIISETKCHVLENPKNGMSVCASNATSVWCSLNCQSGFEVYMEEGNQEMMTMECQHRNPSWKYDPWPDCVAIELPDSIEEVLTIDLDIEEAFCAGGNNSNKAEDQKALMDAIKSQLCGDQENCTIISELPTCEDILGGGGRGGGDEMNGTVKDLDGAVYHTIRRRDLLALEGEATTKKPKRKPKGKLAIKINIYTRLSKKLGIWSANTTRSDNLKVGIRGVGN